MALLLQFLVIAHSLLSPRPIHARCGSAARLLHSPLRGLSLSVFSHWAIAESLGLSFRFIAQFVFCCLRRLSYLALFHTRPSYSRAVACLNASPVHHSRLATRTLHTPCALGSSTLFSSLGLPAPIGVFCLPTYRLSRATLTQFFPSSCFAAVFLSCLRSWLPFGCP